MNAAILRETNAASTSTTLVTEVGCIVGSLLSPRWFAPFCFALRFTHIWLVETAFLKKARNHVELENL